MPTHHRRTLYGLLAALLSTSSPLAQQPAAPVQPQAQQPAAVAAPQLPPQFQLNRIEQAYLDEVLGAWETESAKVNQFQCPFERWEYDAAFGPGPNIPHFKKLGELSYRKPDKGSFQIKQVSKFQAKAVPPGQAPPAVAEGEFVVQPDAIGEHWVCDGDSVYEYRHDQKQLVVRPIPPQMRGKAIVDGPLPFLFGAEAAKLKARYWMRVEQQNNEKEIWIQALPKWQADAADYRAVEVILDSRQMLPKAMQVHMPNGDRHTYMFDLANAAVNGHLQRIMALFESPRTPFGWKRVVEQPPVQTPAGANNHQAAEPAAGAEIQR